MKKIALNALAKRVAAEKLGLIFEGTGRNWALRNLRKGKSFEDLGMVSAENLNTAMPSIRSQASKGVEVGFNVSNKGKMGKVRVGEVGHTLPDPSDFLPETTKSLHTHPYKGLLKGTEDDVLNRLIPVFDQALAFPIPDSSRKMIQEMMRGPLVKQIGKYNKMNKVQKAHPNPFKEPPPTDETFMAATPKQTMNIFNPDDNILGGHKLRPKGIRSFYKIVKSE